ncbi:hypothetical protein KGF56_001099 [Candida oxycetoniae]|uniref:Methyltransferase domain-containing protein n=1 Tax=Candida oxycetoniae TaxID=497107 RepID=A0AAI9T0N5_9ASCO|nr:uncharacterized protein KGF56_001099 [Candida oxycetoniae]KAI3406257.2 hypothetical protein KGF56_001099 [Candida oxycetoniae]
MTSSIHQQAVQNNKDSFNEEFAQKYEQLESQSILSILFVKHILEFDLSIVTTSNPEDSNVVLGDPEKPLNGFSIEETLPDPKTYLQKFPKSIFRPGMKLLDFACGTGKVTELFVPYLTQKGQHSEIVGIDIGSAFLSWFNKRAEKFTSDELTMKSYEYDILDIDNEPKLEQFNNYFDAIICTISYHHIHNYEQVTKKLATFLAPGGWLFIIDFYNEDVERVRDISKATGAVQHMGGLKKDSLNHTLRDISGLINVSSSCRFRTWVYQPKEFIMNHCDEETTKKLESGELKSRNSKNGGLEYLIQANLIYAIGQKNPK